MKSVLFVLLSCLSLSCYAQDTLSKWSWGVVGGVEQFGRRLSEADDNQGVIDQWNSLEENVWRLSGGLRLQRELSEHFSVYSGLVYSDKGYRIDTLQEAGLNSMNFHFRYIELPVGLQYTGMSFGKNALLLGTSLNVGYAFSEIVYYNKNGQTAQFEMSALSNVNPINLNVSAMLGVRRAITNTASLDFYLSGNQALSPLADGQLERRFYSFGVFMALMSGF
jgi:hypothetical protein